MGWGGTLGVIVGTAAIGGVAAFGLSEFLISYQEITSREGAAGYFALFVMLTGAGGGFVIGILSASFLSSDFWKAQGYAAAAVLLLTVLAGVAAVYFDDKAPTIQNEKLFLELELNCPRGVSPARETQSEKKNYCWLQYEEGANVHPSQITGGKLELQPPSGADGQWLAWCGVYIEKSRKPRNLHVAFGEEKKLIFEVPLPASPKPQHMQWSGWASGAGGEFRYRVQLESVFNKEHPDPAVERVEARNKALAAMADNAPIAQWLPFFERTPGDPTPHVGGETFREVEAVRARPLELAALLRSNDRTLARQAVFAAYALYHTPVALVQPLADCAHMHLDLIRDAQNDEDLEKSTYMYFYHLAMALDHAADEGKAARHKVLEEVAQALGPSPGKPHSALQSLREYVQKELAEK